MVTIVHNTHLELLNEHTLYWSQDTAEKRILKSIEVLFEHLKSKQYTYSENVHTDKETHTKNRVKNNHSNSNTTEYPKTPNRKSLKDKNKMQATQTPHIPDHA